MAGPGVPVTTSPIQVTPEGDHFKLTTPPAGFKMPVEGWPPVTANARPLDGGRWALDGLQVKSPSTFVVNMPGPPKDDGTAGAPVPTTYTLAYATQEGGGTWDPTFATPSVIANNSTGFRLQAESAITKSTSTIDRTASTITLRPVPDSRVDVGMDVTGTGYALQATVPTAADGAPASNVDVNATARQVKVQLAMPGVSRDRSAQIIPALVRMGSTTAPAGSPKPPANPEGVRMFIQALDGFASGMMLNEVLDDFAVKGQGFSVAMSQLRFGMDMKAAGPALNGVMDIGLDGLSLPGMGLDMFADLLPRRIALRPVASQIPTKALLDMLQTSIENPKGQPTDAQVAALFSQGGIKTGLESFALEVGGATITGKADVLVSAPDAASGTAQVVATNLDALLAKVQANPMLAQGVPAIVFAKGIGRADGNKVTWDIQFDKTKLLVNGVDMMKMAGR